MYKDSVYVVNSLWTLPSSMLVVTKVLSIYFWNIVGEFQQKLTRRQCLYMENMLIWQRGLV